MKKSIFILLGISIMAFGSCKKEDSDSNGTTNTNNNNSGEPGQTVSNSEYQSFVKPCIETDAKITLPAPLSLANSANLNEQALEMVAITDAGNALISSFPTLFYPPFNVVIADPNKYVLTSADNKGYIWGVAPDKYMYLPNANGYTIYQFDEEDNFVGNELLFVEQSDDCSSFKIIQYETEDNSNDVTFSFFYNKAGTARIMEYGEEQNEPNSERYKIRQFEDLSGEYTKKIDNKTVLSMTWASDGSGTYSIFENGVETESGTWTF